MKMEEIFEDNWLSNKLTQGLQKLGSSIFGSATLEQKRKIRKRADQFYRTWLRAKASGIPQTTQGVLFWLKDKTLSDDQKEARFNAIKSTFKELGYSLNKRYDIILTNAQMRDILQKMASFEAIASDDTIRFRANTGREDGDDIKPQDTNGNGTDQNLLDFADEIIKKMGKDEAKAFAIGLLHRTGTPIEHNIHTQT